jgi:heat shock protein HtpX
MEMCLDNPRQGFGDLFDSHPSVDSRVAALVKFAGGHDCGPVALPPGDEAETAPEELPGPWGSAEADGEDSAEDNAVRPSLKPPGSSGNRDGSSAADPGGPWGPHSGR